MLYLRKDKSSDLLLLSFGFCSAIPLGLLLALKINAICVAFIPRGLLGRIYWYGGLLGRGATGTVALRVVSKVFMNSTEEEKEQEQGLSSPYDVIKPYLLLTGTIGTSLFE